MVNIYYSENFFQMFSKFEKSCCFISVVIFLFTKEQSLHLEKNGNDIKKPVFWDAIF